MAYTGPGRMNGVFGVARHAYDPVANPEYFQGVLSRRILAFVIDLVVITVPVILVSFFILVFGVVTLGLGWALFWLLSPVTLLWTIAYFGVTLGGPACATLGMRAVGIEMRTWIGGPVGFLLGAAHVVLFWFLVSMLTPLVLLVPVFNPRRRALHDVLLGTIVVNTTARAAELRSARGWSR